MVPPVPSEPFDPPLPPLLSEGDLVLREWQPDDLEVLARLVTENLEHLRPWMPWIGAEPLSTEARADLVAGWATDRMAGGDAVYAIEVAGRPVGSTGYHRRVGPGGVEVGYWLAAARQGEGIATRAVRVLVGAALARPDVDRVVVRHDVGNRPSRGVCERAGLVLVGEVPRDLAVLPLAAAETGRDLVWQATEASWRP